MKHRHIKIYTMRSLFFFLLLLCCSSNWAQQFMPIWEVGKMPNSRGLELTDSIDGRLLRRVGTPGIYVFVPDTLQKKCPAVLITPSGGYEVLSYVSAFTVAEWYNRIGIAAFVLKYRLPQSPDVICSYKAPLQDAQRAMRLIYSMAENWSIDNRKIGVMGISAGGHVASCLCTLQEDWAKVGDKLDTISFCPTFAILQSSVISMTEYAHMVSCNTLLGHNHSKALAEKMSGQLHVSQNTPPTFLVHATDDGVVPPENSVMYYWALKEKNIKNCCLHTFPRGGHSLGIRKNPGTASFWPEMAKEWLKEIGILK